MKYRICFIQQGEKCLSVHFIETDKSFHSIEEICRLDSEEGEWHRDLTQESEVALLAEWKAKCSKGSYVMAVVFSPMYRAFVEIPRQWAGDLGTSG